MAATPSRDLFVYVDESGNFDFSPRGTAWFYVTALSTFQPDFGVAGWHEIKYAAIRAGIALEELHAAEDKQWIRDQVFSLLGSAVGTVRVDAVAVEKAKTHPTLRTPERFYQEMMMYLLRYVIAGRHRSFDRLYVFVDTIPVDKKRKAIIGGLKASIAAILPSVPYEVLERDSRAEHLLQLADYAGWALYVARERGELRPKAALGRLVGSDFNIFRRGTTRYY